MLGTPQDRRKWSVLSGLFLVYMASNGITLHTLPLLYPELIETFGWRASEVTLPATVFFVVGALTSPPAGWLLDRYSSRLIIALGGLLLCIGLVAYGMTQTLWQLVAVYALLGLALSLCGLVSNMVMLTSWFSSGRGRATGILLMASSLGGALFPFIVGVGARAKRLAHYGHACGNWRRGSRYSAVPGYCCGMAAWRFKMLLRRLHPALAASDR